MCAPLMVPPEDATVPPWAEANAAEANAAEANAADANAAEQLYRMWYQIFLAQNCVFDWKAASCAGI